MKYKANGDKVSGQFEMILYAMVLILVFEGILRKLLPVLGTPIFFLKDILCLLVIYKIVDTRFQNILAKLNSAWVLLTFLFLPLLLFTSFKDPLLALFASKQYLIYVVTGILVALSFPNHKEYRFRRFIFFTALLLIPTTIVAILQNALPASHWLNLSVGGESLEGFSAGGYLRVGSTFSFTGQYSWFLNAETLFLATSFFMPPDEKFGLKKEFRPVVYSVLALMLIIGAFVTGGRTAVLGCAATLFLGFILISVKRPEWFFKGVTTILLCIISLAILRSVIPQFFMAYDQRATGTTTVTHNEEVTNRILEGFTQWTDWFVEQDVVSVLFGNGLGIMSNGANLVSSYASNIRSSGFWTEGDMATTFWEGGIYLAVIWYGFRLSMIFLSYRMWRMLKNKMLASAASVPFAYVCIQGLTAQFGIQPPLSIWWWLAIGIIIFIARFEKQNTSINSEKNRYQKDEVVSSHLLC